MGRMGPDQVWRKINASGSHMWNVFAVITAHYALMKMMIQLLLLLL